VPRYHLYIISPVGIGIVVSSSVEPVVPKLVTRTPDVVAVKVIVSPAQTGDGFCVITGTVRTSLVITAGAVA
jgi:hypothetical protein